jgi:hypothetical protein
MKFAYWTVDECNFLRELHRRNRAAFDKYAALIESGMRTYDRCVQVATVHRTIAELRGQTA